MWWNIVWEDLFSAPGSRADLHWKIFHITFNTPWGLHNMDNAQHLKILWLLGIPWRRTVHCKISCLNPDQDLISVDQSWFHFNEWEIFSRVIDARINDFELFQVNWVHSPGDFSRVPNPFYIAPQYLITTILYLAARPNSALGSIPPVNGCIVNLQDNLLWKLRKRTLVTEAKCKEGRVFCTKKEEYPDHCECLQFHPSVGHSYLIIRGRG